MNQLKILTLKFITRCKRDSKIHQHMGNTLRGALGNKLKQLYDEKLVDKNIYDYIFKNQTENVYASPFVYGKTNPFILDCEYRKNETIKSGEKLVFNITLLGNAFNYGIYIIEAVKLMMIENISDNIDCFELESVDDYFTKKTFYTHNIYIDKIEPWFWSDTKNIKDNISKIKISFLEPVVLKSNGKLLSNLSFDDFFQAIIRRLILIFSAYEENEFVFDTDSFIIDSKKIITKQSILKFYNYNNYSRTVDGNYPRKGLLGFVEYEGNLNKFLPYVNIGSLIHIGKGTTIGMGKYFWDIID